MNYGKYFAMATPDVEEALDELRNELLLAVDDEEREEEIEAEIEAVEELLQERAKAEEEIASEAD